MTHTIKFQRSQPKCSYGLSVPVVQQGAYIHLKLMLQSALEYSIMILTDFEYSHWKNIP
jgi:hypothetical protein